MWLQHRKPISIFLIIFNILSNTFSHVLLKCIKPPSSDAYMNHRKPKSRIYCIIYCKIHKLFPGFKGWGYSRKTQIHKKKSKTMTKRNTSLIFHVLTQSLHVSQHNRVEAEHLHLKETHMTHIGMNSSVMVCSPSGAERWNEATRLSWGLL